MYLCFTWMQYALHKRLKRKKEIRFIIFTNFCTDSFGYTNVVCTTRNIHKQLVVVKRFHSGANKEVNFCNCQMVH